MNIIIVYVYVVVLLQASIIICPPEVAIHSDGSAFTSGRSVKLDDNNWMWRFISLLMDSLVSELKRAIKQYKSPADII